MTTVVLQERSEVDGRLHSLFGFSREQLLEVVKACVAARGDCTDNDPPAAAGWSAWRYGTRRLREVFRSEGWEKDDTDQFSTIVDHERRIRIAVANTDSGTAVSHLSPRNRSRKGAASERAVDRNQYWLFPDLDVEQEPGPLSDYATWYLCVYAEGDDVRAELSCPIEIETGYFAGWNERIFIVQPGEWEDVDLTGIDGDFGPELQIDVRRR